MDCIFCKIVQGIVPAQTIKKYDECLVIQDIHPKAPIHYLIIPHKHITNVAFLEEHDAPVAAQLLMAAHKVAQSLGPNPAFRLIINNGAAVGQSVFHLHMHFLSGKKLVDL